MQFIKIFTIDDISISRSIFQKKTIIKEDFCAEGSQSVIEKGDKRNISRIFPEYFSDIVAICLNSSMHLQGKQGQKQSFFQGREINQYQLSGKIPNILYTISGEFSQSSKNSTEQSICAVCGVLCRQRILLKSVKLDIRVCVQTLAKCVEDYPSQAGVKSCTKVAQKMHKICTNQPDAFGSNGWTKINNMIKIERIVLYIFQL